MGERDEDRDEGEGRRIRTEAVDLMMTSNMINAAHIPRLPNSLGETRTVGDSCSSDRLGRFDGFEPFGYSDDSNNTGNSDSPGPFGDFKNPGQPDRCFPA